MAHHALKFVRINWTNRFRLGCFPLSTTNRLAIHRRGAADRVQFLSIEIVKKPFVRTWDSSDDRAQTSHSDTCWSQAVDVYNDRPFCKDMKITSAFCHLCRWRDGPFQNCKLKFNNGDWESESRTKVYWSYADQNRMPSGPSASLCDTPDQVDQPNKARSYPLFLIGLAAYPGK